MFWYKNSIVSAWTTGPNWNLLSYRVLHLKKKTLEVTILTQWTGGAETRVYPSNLILNLNSINWVRFGTLTATVLYKFLTVSSIKNEIMQNRLKQMCNFGMV